LIASRFSKRENSKFKKSPLRHRRNNSKLKIQNSKFTIAASPQQFKTQKSKFTIAASPQQFKIQNSKIKIQ
jgi:hypothetical protein